MIKSSLISLYILMSLSSGLAFAQEDEFRQSLGDFRRAAASPRVQRGAVIAGGLASGFWLWHTEVWEMSPKVIATKGELKRLNGELASKYPDVVKYAAHLKSLQQTTSRESTLTFFNNRLLQIEQAPQLSRRVIEDVQLARSAQNYELLHSLPTEAALRKNIEKTKQLLDRSTSGNDARSILKAIEERQSFLTNFRAASLKRVFPTLAGYMKNGISLLFLYNSVGIVWGVIRDGDIDPSTPIPIEKLLADIEWQTKLYKDSFYSDQNNK